MKMLCLMLAVSFPACQPEGTAEAIKVGKPDFVSLRCGINGDLTENPVASAREESDPFPRSNYSLLFSAAQASLSRQSLPPLDEPDRKPAGPAQ